MTNKELLNWQIDMGADEAIADTPRNYFASPVTVPIETPAIQASVLSPAPAAHIAKLQASPSLASGTARTLADNASTLEELENAVRSFDGCALKKTASKVVFADGNPNAGVMIIGEAPGAQEDIQGIPFCGASGALLDKMFGAIGLARTNDLYITNTVFWRPPGNRQPSIEETTICLPLVEKHIALIKPKLLVLAGGTAALTLLDKQESIGRLRGKSYPYQNIYLENSIPTIVTYHPSYLLRQPSQKRLAWQDMLMVKSLLQP